MSDLCSSSFEDKQKLNTFYQLDKKLHIVSNVVNDKNYSCSTASSVSNLVSIKSLTALIKAVKYAVYPELEEEEKTASKIEKNNVVSQKVDNVTPKNVQNSPIIKKVATVTPSRDMEEEETRTPLSSNCSYSSDKGWIIGLIVGGSILLTIGLLITFACVFSWGWTFWQWFIGIVGGAILGVILCVVGELLSDEGIVDLYAYGSIVVGAVEVINFVLVLIFGANYIIMHSIFSVLLIGSGVALSIVAFDDMEEGYPGELDVTVIFTVTAENSLKIEYKAKADKTTLCNLTNHSYFNLNGHDGVGAHDNYLKINAEYFTPGDEVLIPTGEILSVENTPFDFREFKQISKDINANDTQIKYQQGYDCNFCLSTDGEIKTVATAYSENTGIVMNVLTDRPGIQLYTGAFLTNRKGKNGVIYTPNTSFCLETQTYPAAANFPHFPSAVLKTNEKFVSTTIYAFELKK
jgi:aldose 1-epimerase